MRWAPVDKTIMAIGIAGALYQAERIRRVLVVAPLSILGVWEDEFRKFADFEYSLAILSGSSTNCHDFGHHDKRKRGRMYLRHKLDLFWDNKLEAQTEIHSRNVPRIVQAFIGDKDAG